VLCAAWLTGPGVAGLPSPARAQGPAALFAEQLDAENVDRLRVGGPDAIAGIDDWALGNGVLCAAISDPSHETGLTTRGGVLVDLGHCGREDDEFVVMHPLLNLSRALAVKVDGIEARVEGGEARIVTRASQDGLDIVTTYSVDHARPDRLGIRTEIVRSGPGERLFLFGDVVLHGNRQLSAYTASLREPELTVGFTHPDVDMSDIMRTARALVRADLQVLVSAPISRPGISYGWRALSATRIDGDGERHEIATVGLNDRHFSMLAHLSRPPWIGGQSGPPGLLELAQSAFMDLGEGETLVSEREIVISQRPDVASITSRVWADGPRVHGRVDSSDARIHVRDADDRPITFVAPDDDGRFSFRLPADRAGPYELTIRVPDGRRLRRTVAAPPEGVDLGLLAFQLPSSVRLPAIGPVRMIFEGIAPTVDPVFGDDLMEFTLGARSLRGPQARNFVSLSGGLGDPNRVVLPSGQYRVYATRGPEYSVTEATVAARPGQPARLDIEPPQRMIGLPGWVAADLHVHTAASDDTSTPPESQVRAFVASGAQVLVSTDHDRASDLVPIVHRMGLQRRLSSIVGSELTGTAESEAAPFTIGHSNVFPLVPDPTAYREGIPAHEGRRLRSVIAAVHALPGHPFFQLNHPREGGVDGGNGAFLSHLGHVGSPYRPDEPLAAPANRSLIEADPETGTRDLDFDALELLNGDDFEAYPYTRADWVSWHLQGEARTGTANSDSHRLAAIIAIPRNYVAYDGPLGDELDEAMFVQSLREGRAFGTTGPLVQLSIDGATPGDLLTAKQATLSLSVLAAPWVPVDSAFVYVNGDRVHRARIVPGRPIEHVLHFDRDSFVFVEVIGRASDSSVYRSVLPGFTPFAFTNVIRIDADGDGHWTPPGLPEDAHLPVIQSPALPRPLPRAPGSASGITPEAPSAG
jgi:hypothetical protein